MTAMRIGRDPQGGQRSAWAAAALMALALALAGCAAQKPARPAGAAQAAPATEEASLPPVGTEPGTSATAPTPNALKGMTAAELRAGLGDPSLKHDEGPAQLWQYAGRGCVLHIFLYQENGVLRVRRAETRIDDPAAQNPPTCVAWKGKPVASGAPAS